MKERETFDILNILLTHICVGQQIQTDHWPVPLPEKVKFRLEPVPYRRETKMKTIDVKICACTACVMNGSMSLCNSVESMKKVKDQLGIDADIQVEMCKCIGEPGHSDKSPVVSVNGEIIDQAKSEIVMEKITELAK